MEKRAVLGLLVLCLLLATGLALIALLNYRAARRAAEDVLYSRASRTARSFAASARLTGARFDRERLQDLAEEMSADGIGLLVITRGGKVVVSARDGKRHTVSRKSLPSGTVIVRGLSVDGEYRRLVHGAGEPYLELWQPMGPGRRRGPGMRRRWGAGGRSRWQRSGQRLRRRGLRLVRISVPLSLADPVVGPARNTMILAGAASGR